MKTKIIIISFVLGVLISFGGCSSNINSPEEPFIRGKGIEDRIYLVSEGNPEKNVTCSISFNENLLILTFDKEASFTASLWNNGSTR